MQLVDFNLELEKNNTFLNQGFSMIYGMVA